MSPILPRAPAHARAGGLMLGAAIAHETLDRTLLALAPLRRALGRGEIVLSDDGSLTGADRVRAARACGDPQFLAPDAVRSPGFPTGPEWALVLTALDRRRNGYWVLFGDPLPSDTLVPDLARAIAGNRSFAMLDDRPPEELAPHLEQLSRDGFPYLSASRGMIGLAAGGEGRQLAMAILARLEQALGAERVCRADMARVIANFVLARETAPVLMRDKPGAVHSPGRI